MQARKHSVLILGSTGTIGINTLDVLSRNKDRFDVYGLVAGQNIDRLLEQALQHQPKVLLINDPQAHAKWMKGDYSTRLEQAASTWSHKPMVLGPEALDALCRAPEVNTVVAAIVGAAGLGPALAAIESGKRVLLANKESLVLAGQFMMDAAVRHGAALLPVDSEHNAIYQCLPAGFQAGQAEQFGIDRLILTASGGPFRKLPPDQLATVSPAQAVAHPNWVMGRKISVDSATMANKGLELIEALWLFGLPASQLSVLIHPQSIVHSLVEYKDGSTLAQLSVPDMRTPIAHVLGLPDRITSGSPSLNLAKLPPLEFEEPDLARFPMLKLAFAALESPTVLAPVFNAANEIGVAAFLDERIGFLDIVRLVERCMGHFFDATVVNLPDALALDAEVRVHARAIADSLSSRVS